MKKKIVAALIATLTFAAFAACPPYAPYRCVPDYNGKMRCGCGA